MIRVPTNRQPTHPGEVLLKDFLEPLGLNQRELAEGILTTYQRVNEIINGRRGITTSTALRLSKFFKTTPDFWMNLQLRYDLYNTLNKEGEELDRIKPCAAIQIVNSPH
ncbi:MAG: HigA family addiction module antitoxin [Prochloraceae cyanobacterium]|nr:HigA family addiction module antitoxin [Prochloraceae cyanobacterium]